MHRGPQAGNEHRLYEHRDDRRDERRTATFLTFLTLVFLIFLIVERMRRTPTKIIRCFSCLQFAISRNLVRQAVSTYTGGVDVRYTS